nr:hypothetical protein [Tanacetum cinerariifolium]
GHFRVELHAVVAAGVVGHAGDRAAWGAGQNMELSWHLGDLVTVAHPHVEAKQAVSVDVIFNAVEQAALADDFAVNADLTYATGDQLGVLGTEVEDQDTVGVNVEGHESFSSKIRNKTGL